MNKNELIAKVAKDTRLTRGEARNPQTGKAIRLPASKRAKFKAGKLLKEAVNG